MKPSPYNYKWCKYCKHYMPRKDYCKCFEDKPSLIVRDCSDFIHRFKDED